MVKYRYAVESSVEPERLLVAATDFSERRLELAPVAGASPTSRFTGARTA